MSKLKDMVGQQFGQLTVIERRENDHFGKAQWLCRCSCGKERVISGASLRKSLTKSCGCYKDNKLRLYNEKKTVNEIGNTYGRLTVIKSAETSNNDGRALWICQCSCGNIIVTTGKLLRDGHKVSCGCFVKSKGELKIKQLLDSNHVYYKEQFRVDIQQNDYMLKQPHPYYFDFALMDSFNNLLCLIEYDGAQHFFYKSTKNFWNNKDNFEKTVMRDDIKNMYCRSNKIPLIRIPYTRYRNLCYDDLCLETTNFLHQ